MIAVLLAACSGRHVVSPSPAPGEVVTRAADCPATFVDGERLPCFIEAEKWLFTSGDAAWEVRTDGTVMRARNGQVEETRLLLEDNDYIEGVQYAPYGADLILVYGVTNGEYGAGKVARLAGDPLSVRWVVHVPGFNLSTGLIHGRFLYQAAIGFVGKLDLETGAYVWRHDGLYGKPKKYAFNAFETPVLQGGDVLFVEHRQVERIPLIIRVNDATGEMRVE